MAKYLITQEQALERIKAIHGDTYDYSKTSYCGANGKLIVTCYAHGDFELAYSNHTHTGKARGCPSCGLLSRAAKRTQPKSSFLNKAVAMHGERYDYSKVDYKNKNTKVVINCNLHGDFLQSPEKHLAGQNCPECAGNLKLDASGFIRKSSAKHGGVYSYELVKDEHFDIPAGNVPIMCTTHDVFNQNYYNHLFGQGCPKCARFGFNVSKPGLLYVLTSGNKVKIGITNRDISVRLKEINKSGLEFKTLKTYKFTHGKACADTETLLLRYMRDNYNNSTEIFSGSTESFEDVDINSVLDFIGRNIKDGETQ